MSDQSKVTIVNVDDNDDSRYLKSWLLQQAGYRVKEAASGLAALRLVAAERPQLVLLDVNLPDVDGFEVCRQIKADPATASIPVLHISAARTESGDKAQGLESGADGYLTVPVEPEVLLGTVKALLRMRHAEEVARRIAREWATTFDAISDGVCLLDREGKVVRCNRAVTHILAKPFKELLGRPVSELFRLPDEGRESPFARMAQTRAPESVDLPVNERWFRATADPVFDEPGGVLTGAVFILADITERKRAEQERERLIKELQGALAKVKTLSGLLPICSSCKKVRDDQGYWSQIEVYIRDHSEADFSHSICPECVRKLYPDLEL